MTWDSWWGTNREDAAYEYLRTGRLTGPFIPTRCTTSETCAIGWACVNGNCVQVNGPGGANGGYPYPTPPVPGAPPLPGGDCGSGPDVNQGCSTPGPDGCRTATCGDGDPNSDCCGTRCCRFESGGLGGQVVVNCWCGECPGISGEKCGQDAFGNDIVCPDGQVCNGSNCQQPDWCVEFCDTYKKTNGESSPACSSGSDCNECQECKGSIENQYGFTRSYCTNLSSQPCHCNTPSGCNQCNDDGSTTEAKCQICCSTNSTCCNESRQFTTCVPIDSSFSACSEARKAADDWCAKTCGSNSSTPELDPCRGTSSSTTICNSSGNPEDGPPDISGSHPGSSVCGNRGFVKNDETGEICWLLDLCDKTDVPDECKECDCNCNNDCPYCKICGPDGECHDDPSPDCACGGRPKCGESCCPEDAVCIELEAGDKQTLSCCSGRPLPLYITKIKTGGKSSDIDDFVTVGPGRITSSDVCVNCSGNTVPCTQSGARPMFRLLNEKRITNLCLGGVARDIAFQDFVATEYCATSPSWSPIDFPSVVSATPYQTACCPA